MRTVIVVRGTNPGRMDSPARTSPDNDCHWGRGGLVASGCKGANQARREGYPASANPRKLLSWGGGGTGPSGLKGPNQRRGDRAKRCDEKQASEKPRHTRPAIA